MKPRRRIDYTDSRKALMLERGYVPLKCLAPATGETMEQPT